eukprot:CAMPEP_0202701386 /NCGR_PEP_ID=MMETSP1385-20130828/14476_1 /ASSEMBLY_ACC=CAM_ASM_000861 /TAXON_ID=933848 /ORGANISM="Elphidium margaritaceum" /LENGTH=232 /DNA_ID=CAMNT_0049358793 /DNA_START=136 /DNA_END=834 /DNA_ORIENTATION=-
MTDFQHGAYNVFVLWVDFSFIYKLIVVHKAVQNSNQQDNDWSSVSDGDDYNKLLPLITKITVLTMASSITLYASVLCGIFWHDMIASMQYSPHLHVVYMFLGLLDAFTNFITVYLSFAPFQALYLRLCGRCDRCCHSLCIRCTGFKKRTAHSRSTNDETVTSTNDVTSGLPNAAPANMVEGSGRASQVSQVSQVSQPNARHDDGGIPLATRCDNEITVFSSAAVPSAGSPEL